MSLLESSQAAYKPFGYPWCFDAWKLHEQIHWLPEEVPLADDVQDWQHNLTPEEKNLLTQIFRFFTQADVDVSNCYNRLYASIFRPTEVCMMLSGFSARENVHIHAYSHLLDTVGMPEVEYEAFLHYAQMRAKHDYMQGFSVGNRYEIAKTMAAFGAFTEGLQLFASFAILLNFPRFGKMKGMGQIITWSVRDESLHCLSIIKLFKTFISENRDIWTPRLQREISAICEEIVCHEDEFIDLAFGMGDVHGLSAAEVKDYIRYIADRRLEQLGLPKVYGDAANPLPWMDDMLNAIEHTNFFENRATEYSRAATTGTWDEAFGTQSLTDNTLVSGAIRAYSSGHTDDDVCEFCQ